MARDVTGYLSEQQKKNSANAELAQEWTTLEEFYNKRLWHQLTLKLSQFIKHPSLSQDDNLIKLYHNFLADFEHRINPLALVELVIIISKQINDADEASKFLEKIKENVKTSDEANVLCMTAIGNIMLTQRNFEATKSIIKEAQLVLDQLDGVTTVHGRFYELSSNYYQLTMNYAEYYRDALRFLGCMDINDIPIAEQAERAFTLGVAAILGKNVYNFGELLAHPVLDSLKGTPHEWLIDLLFAFNSGDIKRFQNLRVKWATLTDLNNNVKEMEQKISLLCLMEMTFKRPANNRQLTFEQISTEAEKPLDEVELLVMKALSLGLVKGSIDEVERKVHMTWVQPRVLDKNQINGMKERMEHWCSDVEVMEALVETKAHDILT